MEADLEQHDLCTLTIEQMLGLEWRVHLSVACPSTLQGRERAAVCVIPTPLLDECLRNLRPDFLASLCTEQPQHRVVTRHLIIDSTLRPSPAPSSVMSLLNQRVEDFGVQHRIAPAIWMDRGRQFFRRPNDASQVLRSSSDVLPLLRSRQQVASETLALYSPYVTLVASSVRTNLAQECKRLGFAVHLFVVGSEQARLLTEFTSTFDSICLVPDVDFTTPPHLLSLLGGMDVVINNHSPHLSHILGDLRRQGTKLINQLHVVDSRCMACRVGILM